MADNNKENGLPPDWVLDAQRVNTNWFEGDNKEAWLGSKSITFDFDAQQNLPQHIKDKMKADRDNAMRKL